MSIEDTRKSKRSHIWAFATLYEFQQIYESRILTILLHKKLNNYEHNLEQLKIIGDD